MRGDPAGNTVIFKKADGSTALHVGTTAVKDGDLVQIGYFGDSSTLAPTATASNPFKGTFIPLTVKTAIGDHISTSGSSWDAGEFSFVTDFDKTGATYGGDDTALVNANARTGGNNEYSELVTSPFDQSDAIQALDDYHIDGGTEAYLAIRFYDVDTAADGGGYGSGFSNAFNAMYNTVTDVAGSDAWTWTDTDGGGSSNLDINLHDQASSNARRGDLLWEFDNTDFDSDALVDANNILPGVDESTTITHVSDGATITSTQFTGDVVVSNLNLTSGSIDAEGATRALIINSATGNTDTATTPDVSNTASIAGDNLALIKVGAGDQKISVGTQTGGTVTVKEGKLILNNSSGSIFTDTGVRSATSFIDIKGGATLEVAATTGASFEWARYINGEATGTLAFADGNYNIELGLDSTDGAQTFAGIVSAPSTGGNVGTIKIENDSSSPGSGHQKVDELTGAGDIKKTGAGILEITGDSSAGGDSTTAFSGNLILEGGTLVLSDANALNGNGITGSNFKYGKVAINDTSGNFNDDFSTTGAGSGKSVIGGTGKFDKTIVIDDATGSNTFNELDPGTGAASSLSNTGTAGGSPHQSVQKPGDTIGTFEATGLTWNDGGIYNWEISDMTGSTAGTDWDLFKFSSGTLALSANSGRKIKIFGITTTGYTSASTGTHIAGGAGQPDNWAYTPGEFKFLEATGGATITGASDGELLDHDYFDIDSDDFEWMTQNFNGVWQVKYKAEGGGALYLTYTPVPEPSTYVMVLGALFLPVWSFFRRRFRRKEEE